LASRSKALQRQVQAGRTLASAASLPPAERAWVTKETSASGVIVIEALSRALPDSAYLTELRLEGATLRIIGLAGDAPALLAPLERSGHLTNVRFFAPTTRGPDGKLFRFNIEARVEPRINVAEE
jgi:general secretion pathway protein L